MAVPLVYGHQHFATSHTHLPGLPSIAVVGQTPEDSFSPSVLRRNSSASVRWGQTMIFCATGAVFFESFGMNPGICFCPERLAWTGLDPIESSSDPFPPSSPPLSGGGGSPRKALAGRTETPPAPSGPFVAGLASYPPSPAAPPLPLCSPGVPPLCVSSMSHRAPFTHAPASFGGAVMLVLHPPGHPGTRFFSEPHPPSPNQ